MAKDWKAIAQAAGLDLSAREMDRVVLPLENLEAAFRPLVQDLSCDIEPAFTLGLEDGE